MLCQVSIVSLTAALTLLTPPRLVYGKNTQLCDLNDSDCLTESAKRMMVKYWSGGIPNVPYIESIFEEQIVIEHATLNYTGRNITLSGLKSCSPELVKIYKTDVLVSDYRLACKHLNVRGQFESYGVFGKHDITGKGPLEADFYDYILLLPADLEMVVGDDQKLYINVLKYKFNTEPRGSLHYTLSNQYFKDTSKTAAGEKFFNDNWKEIEKYVMPLMERLFATYISTLSLFLKLYPIEDLFYIES